jgi:hypothetical protein
MATKKSDPKPPAQLLAEYASFPDDQPVNEQYGAARLQKSRAWMQLKRVKGGGPQFQRTDTGKIFYFKRDVEDYLAASLRSYESTSQYPDQAKRTGKRPRRNDCAKNT